MPLAKTVFVAPPFEKYDGGVISKVMKMLRFTEAAFQCPMTV